MDATTSTPASFGFGGGIGLEGEPTSFRTFQRRLAPLLQADIQADCPTTNSPSDEPPPLVVVTALLGIHPPEYERQFWQSCTWQQSVRGLDICYLPYIVVNNGVLLLYRKHRWPGEKSPFVAGFMTLYLVLAVLQSFGAYYSVPRYHRARPVLVGLNRGVRLFQMSFVVLAFRACFLDGSCISSMHQETKRGNFSPAAAFLRTLFTLSMTYPTIMQTSYMRFHFRMQLPVQAVHLALIVVCNSAGTANILSEPYIVAPASTLCHVIDHATAVFITQAAGSPPAPSMICDTNVAPWLLVVLTQVTLAFLLPLCIAYCLERHTKFRFLHDELRLVQFDPGSVWSAVATAMACLLLLLCYAVLSWLLLLQHYRSLVRWVLPWDWPGAHSGWYHELLAS